jgi:hypothetical protein
MEELLVDAYDIVRRCWRFAEEYGLDYYEVSFAAIDCMWRYLEP